MTKYDITKYNNTHLTSIYPLEGDGTYNYSSPLRILDIDFNPANPAIIVSSDVSYRFNVGFRFDIVGNTPYDGSYTVSGQSKAGTAVDGKWYTRIPISSPIIVPGYNNPLPILDVIINHTPVQGQYEVLWKVDGDHTSTIEVGSVLRIQNTKFNGVVYPQNLIASSVNYVSNQTHIMTLITTDIIETTPNSILLSNPATYPYGNIRYINDMAHTSLHLIGPGSSVYNDNETWGLAFQLNKLYQLENFNNTIPPIAPLTGQIWNNSATSLRVFNEHEYPKYEIIDVARGAQDYFIISGDLTSDPGLQPGKTIYVYNNFGVDDLATAKFTIASTTLSLGTTLIEVQEQISYDYIGTQIFDQQFIVDGWDTSENEIHIIGDRTAVFVPGFTFNIPGQGTLFEVALSGSSYDFGTNITSVTVTTDLTDVSDGLIQYINISDHFIVARSFSNNTITITGDYSEKFVEDYPFTITSDHTSSYTTISSTFDGTVTIITYAQQPSDDILAVTYKTIYGILYSDDAWYDLVVQRMPLQGNIDMNGYRIINLGDPIDPSDAANKQYVDDQMPEVGAGLTIDSDRIIVDNYSNGGLFNTINGVTVSTDPAAQLSVKLNGSSLSLTTDGLSLTPTGILPGEYGRVTVNEYGVVTSGSTLDGGSGSSAGVLPDIFKGILTTYSTSQQVVLSIDSTTFETLEYTIQAVSGESIHTTKILATHDGTTVSSVEYGTIYNVGLLGTFEVVLASNNIQVLVTPSYADEITFKVVGTVIIKQPMTVSTPNMFTNTITTGSVFEHPLLTIDKTTYQTIEYTIQAISSVGDIHTTKILTSHDDTIPYTTEFGTLQNNGILGIYNINVQGSDILLSVNPSSADATTFRVYAVATTKTTAPVIVLPDTIDGALVTTSIDQQVLLTFDKPPHHVVEYTIQAVSGLDVFATKILASHNNTQVTSVDYGGLNNNGVLGTFDVVINSNNIQLLVTPASSNLTTFRATGTLISGMISLTDLTDVNPNLTLYPGALLTHNGNTWDTDIDVDLNNNTLNRPMLTGYAEVINSSAVFDTGVLTIDLVEGNTIVYQLTGDITDIVINNSNGWIPGMLYAVTLILIQNDTTPYLVTWPTSFKWDSSTPIIMSPDLEAIDVLNLISYDPTTTWLCFPAAQSMG